MLVSTIGAITLKSNTALSLRQFRWHKRASFGYTYTRVQKKRIPTYARKL